MPPKSKRAATVTSGAHSYAHDNKAVQRPDVGLQQEFLKVRKPPKTYRYDSSLDPALSWDENPGREQAEWLLGLIERCAEDGEGVVFAEEQLSANGRIRVGSLKSCVAMLKNLSQPFLNWSGKAERADIQVPTLPLFVHERHSTKAIIDGLVNHKAKGSNLDLFGDPGLDLTDKLRAYEHVGPWTNRMILGDSLVAMNSLLEYEGLGGQVQMIYIDPPYGVKFGSNFQPFVRSKPGCGSARDVKHGADDAMTREPEMVKAYRDTWELGLHSYLAYLRDRLLLARELLTDSGSVFVQISDENLHHVRHLLDEVFGPENFASQITFQKTSGSTTATIPTTSDYLLWYAKDIQCVKFHKLYVPQVPGAPGAMEYKRVELADGALHPIGRFRDDAGVLRLPDGAQIFATDSIVSKGGDDEDVVVEWEGKKYRLSCKPNRHWKCGADGVTKLWDKGRLLRQEGLRIFKRYLSDFPFRELVHVWTDTRGEDDPAYVVQTDIKPIERCVLMTTDPGDLVLDPTCGSGTTACVAEQWGRRWITIDTSRVPLALARQRLLTATFPYYELLSPNIGPRGGFVYQRKQNRKGEEIGGLVPHITLKSIANNEEPALEVLVDRPEVVKDVTRVSGPFTV
ncbi:MAG TPA: site-specific DNA-methyltransferase, partial [Methylococcaceae bacterium]|nr:site-specific DNA-methyltransferase [Methylococcaceae bacterium]